MNSGKLLILDFRFWILDEGGILLWTTVDDYSE